MQSEGKETQIALSSNLLTAAVRGCGQIADVLIVGDDVDPGPRQAWDARVGEAVVDTDVCGVADVGPACTCAVFMTGASCAAHELVSIEVT